MGKYSGFVLSLCLTGLVGLSPLTLLAKTLTTDSNSTPKKHSRHKKKKVTNEDAIPLEPQTEVTDQREVSGQPAETPRKKH